MLFGPAASSLLLSVFLTAAGRPTPKVPSLSFLLLTTGSGLPGAPTAAFTAVSVFYGNGSGTFNAPNTLAVAPFDGFTTGDFNGDGITDLAVLVAPAPFSLFTSVQILLGSNSEIFSQGVALPVAATAAASIPDPMAAVALTGDGNLDLVVTTNVLNVFHGDGKGGFTPSGTYGVSAYATLSAGYLFADVNGDGNQDLIAASQPSQVFLFLGDGGSTFQAPPCSPVSGPVADVNNDASLTWYFFRSREGTTLARRSAEEMVASRS
jgi:hypothetical protein